MVKSPIDRLHHTCATGAQHMAGQQNPILSLWEEFRYDQMPSELFTHGPPLYYVSLTGQIDIFKQICDDYPDSVKQCDHFSNTPLHLILDPIMIQTLLEHGAQINAKNKLGKTPLWTQCYLSGSHEQHAFIIHMIDNGALVNEPDNDGRTPLMAAISSSAPIPLIVRLLDHGADPCARSNHGETPLWIAAQRWNQRYSEEVCEHLFARGATWLFEGIDLATCA